MLSQQQACCLERLTKGSDASMIPMLIISPGHRVAEMMGWVGESQTGCMTTQGYLLAQPEGMVGECSDGHQHACERSSGAQTILLLETGSSNNCLCPTALSCSPAW
jgi:hypothetical protein